MCVYAQVNLGDVFSDGLRGKREHQIPPKARVIGSFEATNKGAGN